MSYPVPSRPPLFQRMSVQEPTKFGPMAQLPVPTIEERGYIAPGPVRGTGNSAPSARPGHDGWLNQVGTRVAEELQRDARRPRSWKERREAVARQKSEDARAASLPSFSLDDFRDDGQVSGGGFRSFSSPPSSTRRPSPLSSLNTAFARQSEDADDEASTVLSSPGQLMRYATLVAGYDAMVAEKVRQGISASGASGGPEADFFLGQIGGLLFNAGADRDTVTSVQSSLLHRANALAALVAAGSDRFGLLRCPRSRS